MTSLPRWKLGDLDALVATGAPLVVELRREGCSQCGPQEAVLIRIASRERGLLFGTVDIEENPEIVDRLDLVNVPATAFYRGGILRGLLPGFRRPPELMPLIDEIRMETLHQ